MEHMNQENKTDATLSRSRLDERYQTLFEQVNAAAFLTSYDGQIHEANHKSCDLLGYSWDELMHLSLKDLFEEGFDWLQFQEEVAARGGFHLESEIMKKDGDFKPVDISTSLFRMNNKPMMFVLIWDITERKLAEKKIKESEKKYRGLFEYTTDGVIVLDARGDILDVNTKMCQLFDYTKDELIGKNLLSMDLLTSNSLPVVIGQFQQLLSEKTAKNYTTEIKTRADTILTVEISSFFLVKKNNEVDNFVLSIRNITDRIHLEKRRIIEHQLFQTLLNTIPDSVYFKDTHHRFILVNPAKAKHCNTTTAAMVGKTDAEFYPQEVAKTFHEDEDRIMNTGAALINKIEQLTRNNGERRWVSVTKVPWHDESGDIIGVMGVSRDITDVQLAKDTFSQHKDLLQTLIDTLPDYIYFKDATNTFILVNKTMANAFAIPAEQLIGKTEVEYRAYDCYNSLFEDDANVLETSNALKNKKVLVKGLGGADEWYVVTKVPIKDHTNHCIGLLSIARISTN